MITTRKLHVSESMHCGDMLACVRDEEGDIVASGCFKQDAQMFATAPRVLEALRAAVRSYQPTQMAGADWVYPEWYTEAKAAIAEADGEV